ncbi:MAG TPA: hypothetical protein VH413_17400 [Verrucomicrobiae bacterium]|jgi:hypothetical protein|nr:hypothetical protein [Verrucomicrobiae bacterium]
MKALEKSVKAALRKWSKMDKTAIRFVAPYTYAHKDVQEVKIAYIATDLGPRLDKVLKRNSRLCVIGYDGASLAKSGYIWTKKLSVWLERGCSVDYLLHAPAPGVVSAVAELAQSRRPGAGQFRIFQIKKNPRLSLELKSEIEQFRTFHFAVSEHPNTLWIETNHQTSDPKAFDCYFFPETAATETGLAEIYLKRFERVVKKVGEEISLVREQATRLNRSSRSFRNRHGGRIGQKPHSGIYSEKIAAGP